MRNGNAIVGIVVSCAPYFPTGFFDTTLSYIHFTIFQYVANLELYLKQQNLL